MKLVGIEVKHVRHVSSAGAALSAYSFQSFEMQTAGFRLLQACFFILLVTRHGLSTPSADPEDDLEEGRGTAMGLHSKMVNRSWPKGSSLEVWPSHPVRPSSP